jgi:hypothetical protein
MDQRTGIAPDHDGHAALPAVGLSLLRISVPARLGFVAVLSMLLWGAVFWALA